MSSDTPDLTEIVNDIFIGNLASAKTLHAHPELGITHVLSVCPEYPEAKSAKKGATSEDDAPCPTVEHPLHRCIPVQDSEYEDILVHLPSAVAFIRDALVPSRPAEPQHVVRGEAEGQQVTGEDSGEPLAEVPGQEVSSIAPAQKQKQKHRVLVHCVMGISRSATVVCAYLMATRQLSFPAALMLIRKRRPHVHPNYGFRRQLQVFGDCSYFANYPAPVRTHPAHAAWHRKKKREASRYLTRVGDIVEIKMDDEKEGRLSLTDDFPTDPTEASSLLSEIEATHFLTISPASLPPLTHSAPPSTRRSTRLSGVLSPPMSLTLSSSSSSDSPFSSPLSSRSSSFSFTSHLSSPISTPSTAATSVNSLPLMLPPSKLRVEASSSSSDSEDEITEEPGCFTLAGIEHHHINIGDSTPASQLVRLNEASSFISRSLCDYETSSSDSGSGSEDEGIVNNVGPEKRKHVLIYCTTESRACAVVCAYLMSCKGLTPSKAYTILEKALPLFNPTKSFFAQLELFNDCEYNPTLDHPLVRSWLAGGCKPALSGHSSSSSSSTCTLQKPSRSRGAQWKVESDNEGDEELKPLHQRLGTPLRCGSFSSPVPSPCGSGLGGRVQHAEAVPRVVGGDVDVEGLLQHCEGVGDPKFAFDVEAFRGALQGVAAGIGRRT